MLGLSEKIIFSALLFKGYNIRYLSIPTVLFISIALFFIRCGQSPSPRLSPIRELGTFKLADNGLEIELVAAEPLVQDPVAMAFDEAGRLWVVEMKGFMADIDGTGENERVGRVSVLFDDDRDGKMDRSIVFLDSLVLPRAIAIVKGGILIAENIPLWFAKDTDGDFKADTKTLIDPEYGGLGLPEHSPNGLWRGMDNWYYNAKSKWRYRKKGDGWIKEETEIRGQWGISHDNAGRLFYNYNWSQLHADLVPPNILQRNKNHTPTSGIDHGVTLERRIFPIRSTPAVNRGYVPGTLDKQGRLLEFTSACGPLVYRGNLLPNSYLGNAFVCEPTSNLIKQNKIIEEGFMLRAEGVYEDREFLASTDERFRPVSLASGPDGALYVVDMYKGIIQHGPYMTPYLRKISLERKLDSPIHMGRIWRIKPKMDKIDTPPDLTKAGSPALVKLLGHPNGWTRDMAQRLLVEKGDLSIVTELEHLLVNGTPLGQLHALWTLEGLYFANPTIYATALKAKDPKVAQAALRLAVDLLPEHPEIRKDLELFIKNGYGNADPVLQLQMILASGDVSPEIAFMYSQKFLENYGGFPLARDVVMSSLEHRESAMLAYLLAQKEWNVYDQHKEIFLEMLATAITNTKSLVEIIHLLQIVAPDGGKGQTWIKMAIANGIVNSNSAGEGEVIFLENKPAIFKGTSSSEPEMASLLNRLSQLFTWPGKPEAPKPETNTAEATDPKVMASGRLMYINLCAGCHGTKGDGMPRFAPPLKNSEWVTGADYKLGMILLHGLEGPIIVNGKEYGIPDILPSMPSFSTLQDRDIAAICTYIRNSWGNAASNVSNRTIGGIRIRTQGKITPWNAAELDTLIFKKEL